MDYLKVGVITSTHGLRGGIKVYPMTDDSDRFKNMKWVYIEGSDRKWIIREIKIRPKDLILQLEGLDSIEQVEPLRGKHLYSDETQRPELEEDRYYIKDLVGLQIYLTDGEHVGTLTQVISTGAHDVYVVTSLDGKKEWMIPAVKAFIKKISLEEQQVIIEPIEGLLS
ncbi:MAG: ribosome maturation factor RimM [Bacillota bacterium]|nr:ribosome maturation factor RimM [Bacillota bacterium]MDW7676079.1 ribosome maturation factor RimM [Bacillota bacterium]